MVVLFLLYCKLWWFWAVLLCWHSLTQCSVGVSVTAV